MNNNILITDSAKFEEIIQSLEKSYNKIKEIFLSEQNNKEEINSTDTWTSNAQKAMYGKYAMLTNNFGPIEYSLEVYIKFLKKTLEDYKRLDEEITKNMDYISNELDVNS